MAPISPKHVLAAPIIDFPHGTILIPAVTPAAELSAAEQRNKRTGAHYLWARPPAVESAKAAVRVMLPLQWPLTRRMDEWQAAYWAFYDLGIALGPISRFKEPPLSSPNGAVKLLYGSVASEGCLRRWRSDGAAQARRSPAGRGSHALAPRGRCDAACLP